MGRLGLDATIARGPPNSRGPTGRVSYSPRSGCATTSVLSAAAAPLALRGAEGSLWRAFPWASLLPQTTLFMPEME